MKISSRDADSFIAKTPATIRAILLYGENAGLARDYADAFTRRIVPNPKDNERLSDLSAADIRKDPARLSDEASQMSMFSPGRRVIRIRDASEGMGELFSSFLKDSPGDAFILVESGELGARASLRVAFEQAPNAAAIACYDEGIEALAMLAASELKSLGVEADDGALEVFVTRVGMDRRLVRSELQKVALYFSGEAPSPKRLTKGLVEEFFGQSGDVEANEVSAAAAEGDVNTLDRMLVLAEDAGGSPSFLVTATLRHFHALLAARAVGQIDDAVAIARSRGLWGVSDATIRSQLRLWPQERLTAAVRILGQAEASVRTTSWPEWPVAARALLHVARLAR